MELARLDYHTNLKRKLLPKCRLRQGEVWQDPVAGHRVGALDATSSDDMKKLFGSRKVGLLIADPPYNIVVGSRHSKENLSKRRLDEYMDFSNRWIENALAVLGPKAHLYVWMGADFKDGFQPLADFILMMRQYPKLKSRNLITMRNQRGFGTPRNWMWLRQELLYYIKGRPEFNVKAEYTDIPRLMRGGYYKCVNGKMTDTLERSKSRFIRAGNVWVDIQQIFYKREERAAGCYAQKPLKAIERLISSGSKKGELVADFFSHSGTGLIAGERLGRKVYTFDIDPIFAELTIRRLDHYRKTGKTGWGRNDPFSTF